jgi:iron complex outermembrane receptor protein
VHLRTRAAARRLVIALVLAAAPAALQAQQPARPDSAARDTVQRLETIEVTVTRTPEPLERVPAAVSVLGTTDIRRGQATLGLDESLNDLPGVYVANRYNFSLDQRLSIRGFGSRSSFGTRGVKILLDGVPQTLPDGQSQLTNVELAALSRVEVLRGSASSLYGNGAGGVLSFTSDLSASSSLEPSTRLEAGSYGLRKWQARVGGRGGRAVGALSLSRLTWDGFRPHSDAEVRQLNAAVDYATGPNTVVALRVNVGDVPTALNPGALTATEFAADPTTAAQSNILRGTDKRVSQQQVAVRLRHDAVADGGWSWDASVFGLGRDLRNAIGSAPPPPSGPTSGTYITIDRAAAGARLSGGRRLGGATAPQLTAGVQWQWMRDDRANYRATAGRPTAPGDTLLLDQRETVWSVGPFAQLAWSPLPPLTLNAGVRHDRVRFAAADRFTSDGDDGGARSLPAWSGHLGASYLVGDAFVPYANVSTSFETPTTVELQGRADGGGGFSTELGPQRTVTIELGARGTLGGDRLGYSVAAFRTRVSDAIVQYEETNGRAFYRNAGATDNDGVELGLEARLHPAAALTAAYTWAHYRFGDYRVVNGSGTTVLDGKRIPGVPEHFLRLGLRTRPLPRTTLDVDQTISSAVFADDANALRVEGWGPGITRARASWSTRLAGVAVQPFAGVENLFDRAYVSTVVVNGFGGRVREPGPGRNWYFGMEIGR